MVRNRYSLLCILVIGLTNLSATGYTSPFNCEDLTIKEKSRLKTTNCIDSSAIDDHFKSSYNKHSYTLEESVTIKNQLNDILGVKNLLHRRKRNEAGFPEKRMRQDSREVWDSYTILMRSQFNPISKFTQDIKSGYNSSLSK